MAVNDIEQYKQDIRKKLEILRPVFAKAIVGDFSENISIPEEEDEFIELYTGVQTMLEVIRAKISALETEVGQRQEVEERLRARTKELADGQKALTNVLEDLAEAKGDIEQESAKYAALLSSIGDGIIAVDKEGIIIFVNSVAEKILGFKVGEMIDRNQADVIRLEDEKGDPVPADKRLMALAIGSGKTASSSEYYYKRSSKTRFPVAITVSPVVLGNKIVGGMQVFRDITKEKELDKAKSEFISVASHQLRTPVSALNWITESLRVSLKGLDKKQKEYFDDFSISVNRLVRLVEDLLNVSRIDMGTLKLDAKETELAGFVKDFMKSIKAYADLKKHEVIFKNLSQDGMPVVIDPKVLYDILQNLVSNAIDYSPMDTAVTVTLEKDGGYGKISVANGGPVIPEEEQVRLFEKFYRGESGQKIKQEGTGLGLYIVKSLVENSGGKTGFVSEKGKETIFWFTLPLVK